MTKKQLEKFTGLFRLKEGNLMARISVNDKNRLNWEIIDRNTKSECYIESKEEFKMANGQTLRFNNDNADSLLLITKSGKSISCTRLNTVSEINVEDYTGTYFSEELKAFIEIKKSGQNLVFKCGEILVKSPVLDSSCSIQFNEPRFGKVSLQFHKNKRGKPDSFLISTERTNNLKFNKPIQNSNRVNN